jgi:hypothetical protein
MVIDDSAFPIVWLRTAQRGSDGGSSESGDSSPSGAFEIFEALLAREQPFVILQDDALTGQGGGHGQEEMKQVSIWMKRNKAALRSFVKASIHIEPSLPRQLSAKAFAVMYKKFWGYPLLFAATRSEAVALANQLLAE